MGGTFKMSFANFTTGRGHSFGGEYLELTPHERICYTDKFDDPGLPGEMRVTVTLKKVSVGTELPIEQAGIPPAIPLEACYLRDGSNHLRSSRCWSNRRYCSKLDESEVVDCLESCLRATPSTANQHVRNYPQDIAKPTRLTHCGRP